MGQVYTTPLHTRRMPSDAECRCLSLRQCFCEEISDHILGLAVTKFNHTAGFSLSDK